ncbi:hypothetical protein CAter10_1356 [Collimonas arenae]|nr:hypothetical protein CAter10_1356 [Collimonas arenae]
MRSLASAQQESTGSSAHNAHCRQYPEVNCCYAGLPIQQQRLLPAAAGSLLKTAG